MRLHARACAKLHGNKVATKTKQSCLLRARARVSYNDGERKRRLPVFPFRNREQPKGRLPPSKRQQRLILPRFGQPEANARGRGSVFPFLFATTYLSGGSYVGTALP